MEYLLTGVTSKEVILRKDGKSKVLPHRIPYTFYSYPNTKSKIEELYKSYGNLKDFMKQRKLGVTNRSLEVNLPKRYFDLRKRFVRGFPKEKPSYLEVLRWKLGFPLSIVDDDLNVLGKASLEDLLNDKILCFDIETKYPLKDEVYSIAVLTAQGRDVVDERIYTTTEFEVDTSYSVIVTDNEMDLIEKFRRFVMKVDPLIIMNQNLRGFDLPKLMEKHPRGFNIGPNKKPPKKLGRFFPPKLVLDGRILIDTYIPSLFKIFPNAKLSTLAEYLKNDTKALSHEELARHLEKALEGNDEAKRTILEYNMKDVQLSYGIGMDIIEDILSLSMALGVDPSTFGATSYERLVQKYKERYFWSLGYSRPKHQIDRKKFEKFDPKEKFMREVWKSFNREIIRGRFEDVYVLYPNFSFLGDIFFGLEDVLGEGVLQTEVASAFLKDLLFDLEMYESGKLGHMEFYKRHLTHPDEFRKRLDGYKKKLKEDLKDSIVLNVSKDFLFAKDVIPSDSYFVYDVADVLLSCSKGVVFFQSKGRIFSIGANFWKNYGYIVPYEKQVLGSVLNMVFNNDLESLIPYLEVIKEELKEERVPEELRIKEFTLGMDYFVYSSLFKERQKSIANQIRGRRKNEVVPLVKRHKEILDSLFGRESNGKRSLKSGKVGLLLDTILPLQDKSNKYKIESLLRESPLVPEGQTTLF